MLGDPDKPWSGDAVRRRLVKRVRDRGKYKLPPTPRYP
jgi:hypothetical protein